MNGRILRQYRSDLPSAGPINERRKVWIESVLRLMPHFPAFDSTETHFLLGRFGARWVDDVQPHCLECE